MAFRESLCSQAAMLRDRKISVPELIAAHLAQIERANPRINAFVEVFKEQALAQAKSAAFPAGPLHGLPLTVKDSFDVAGVRTLVGHKPRLNHRAAEDAPAVRRLREAGAIIVGKTNTPELLASYESTNEITGTSRNPWDLERTPGGSSGGEAAAIAAYCSAGGIGSDGGGSIRVPAHFCGIAGLKPTPGRIPIRGHFPAIFHPSGILTVAGPMARTASDLQLLFSVLAAYDPEDPFSIPLPARAMKFPDRAIGVWPGFYDVGVGAGIAEAVAQAAIALRGLGHTAEPFVPAGLENAPNVWSFLFSELWPESVEGKPPVSGLDVLKRMAARDRMRAKLLRQMDTVTVLLMPVCGIPAFLHGQKRFPVGEGQIGLFQAMMPATIWNLLGFPALTLPWSISSEGLPLGIQLVGRPFEEEALLDLAIQLEGARGALPAMPADFGPGMAIEPEAVVDRQKS